MIIGLCGQAGAGKDTVADFLVKDHGFVKVAFADPLKRICKDVFDFSDEQLWGPSEERNKPDTRYPRPGMESARKQWDERCRALESYEKESHPDTAAMQRCVRDTASLGWLTPRHALQQLGTEWARRCYDNIWVDYALRVAKEVLTEQRSYSARYGIGTGANGYQATRARGVVIPDVRFSNEVNAVRFVGGAVWRVERPGAGLVGPSGQHVSEQEQLGIPAGDFSFVVNNKNGPMEDLEKLVTATLHGTLRLFDTK